MLKTVERWLGGFNLPVPDAYFHIFSATVSFLVLAVSIVCFHLILKRLFIPLIVKMVQKTEFKWDDSLLESGLLVRIFQFVPLVLLYKTVPILFVEFSWVAYFQQFLELWLVLQGALVVNSTLNAVLIFSRAKTIYKSIALKSYIQVLRLIVFSIAGIIMVSVLIGKSPLVLLSGIGALSAVLLLVFKDSILGFVASLQLTFNKLVETGDWIEVPEYGADGNVVDVSLNTIKVQNWDKTITTIPTYSLISGSFKNWKGMEDSGGRRIKRSINLDMNSVRFVDDALLEKFKQFRLLKLWLHDKLSEIRLYNNDHDIDEPILNGRHLTNLGVFRAYLELYLQQHPDIHEDMTFLVRHLAPNGQGIPVEFYVFSKNQNWADYEAIQADIMDHILAILPQFGLRVFQEPSGYDMKILAISNAKK